MSLRLEPQSRSMRYNRALTLLQAGRWEEGWKEYEYRWGRKKMPQRQFAQPRWDGSPLNGRTVLAWCEQGLGDAIQFVRFAGLLAEQGARVVLECPQKLVGLFSTCRGIERVVAERQELPPFDVQVPLMSLPGLLGVTPERVPGSEPYLWAEPGRVEAWRQRLGASEKVRVGIAWQGNPRFVWDRWRSAPLRAFAALAEVDGVELISLQQGPGSEQLAELRGRFAVTRLEGLDREGFLDTAAVMKCLDLVVCVDTAAGHLAGALGVPVWLALAAVADWRWLREREDTPWYPGMRLWRQRQLGEWDETFAQIGKELVRIVKHARGQVSNHPGQVEKENT